ncbi:hypothetical protein ID866_8918 [Astraeus odoratus]|nr:hypothetical protein ID866_8918 [Astraeus odoratus]
MKLQKFFSRDKPKAAKVIPLARDSEAPPQTIIDEASRAQPIRSISPLHHVSDGQDAVVAHHGSFQSAAVLPSPPFQPHEHPRLAPHPSADDHWEVVPPGEESHHGLSPRPHQQHFPAPVIPSRSSSLGSLPPGASPPMPNAAATIPRSSSPFSVASHTTSVQHPTRQRSERDIMRKKSPGPTGVAALGILRALEPSHQDSQSLHHQDFSEDYHMQSEPVRTVEKEKKERRGFWDGMLKDSRAKDKERDRERDRARDRDRDRRDDDVGSAELTRMIGYLTATASEDWSIVLEVCERASANEANAKEAAKALRREFKQVNFDRLWAIMLRNASDIFITQISQRKFIETLEDVLTSSRTSPVVRERLMEVLAAAAYITSRSQSGGRDKDKDKEGFRALWCRLKPADKPETGVPFDTDDAMFSPPVSTLPRPLSQYSLETPTFAQQTFARELSPTPPPVERTPLRRRHKGIIPLEEDIQRLFQECKIARGNASVLSETLAFAKPDALGEDLIPEFLAKCRASQELLHGQIPWATAGAERSRAERILEHGRSLSTHGSHQDLHASLDQPPNELTVEEELLAALLDANEALVGALRMYDDLARIAMEKAAEERSRREVRMSRRVSYSSGCSKMQDKLTAFMKQLDEQPGEPPGTFVGSPRPGSPPLSSPPTSPRQQFEMPAVVPSPNHPLPRIPPNLTAGTPSLAQVTSHQHHYHSQANTPTLLAPPHPLGPRSPGAQVQTHSRTPSPDRTQRFSRNNSPDSRQDILAEGLERTRIENEPLDGEDVHAPARPSAKALGKRRVIEDPDGEYRHTSYAWSVRLILGVAVCYSGDQLNDRNTTSPFRDSALDSDSDEMGFLPRRPPIRYVYDAAAERTAQHLKEGRVSVLVNGVH